MSYEGAPQYVRMPGRDEVGTVIQAGKNYGSSINVYAFVILIEETGEVCFYDSKKLTRCDKGGNVIERPS